MRIKCLSQEHNALLPSLGIEPGFSNLSITNAQPTELRLPTELRRCTPNDNIS